MSNYRQSFGKWGEEFAARYLCENGYTILARNVRTPYGEVDLIVLQTELPSGMSAIKEEPVIVFVEVKTRSSTKFGLPEDAITVRKQEHILAAAQFYLQENPNLEGDWRIDVVAIQRDSSLSEPTIEHFENAFTND